MKLNLSIRSLLIFLAISFAIPAVMLFGLFEARRGAQQARLQAQEMNRQAGLLIHHDITSLLQQFKTLTEGLSTDVDPQLLRFAHPDRVMRILKDYPGIAFLLLNEKAVSVATYAFEREIGVGVDFSDRDYIRRVFETRNTVVSGAIQIRTAGTPAIVFCVPLIGEGGDIKGFLGGGIPTALFHTKYELAPEQFAVVLDTFGSAVSGTNVKGLEKLAPRLAKAAVGRSLFQTDNGGAELYIAEVQPIGWKVALGLPDTYVTARANEAIGRAALVALICTVLGAVLASSLAFSTVRGLDNIGKQAQAMPADDLQPIRLSEETIYPREVRTLVSNFNSLLDRAARTHQAEFEAISRVADAIIIARADGHITYANAAGTRLFGGLAGKTLTAVFGEETAASVFSRESPQEWKADVSVRKADGTAFDAFLSSSPILEDGELKSVVLIVQDVTREKAAREAVAHSEKMITLGELVAGTSHELNNPLAIVTGYADLLLEEDGLNPEHRSKIESIRKSAIRAANIVHSLLAFARKRKTERTRTDINEVIEAALQLKEYDIRTSGIRLEKSLAPDLPPVSADPHQMQQVFLNVLNNAQDATGSSPDDRVITVKSETRDGRVLVTIEDTGTGISKADLKKVFDPFFTTKPLGKGTGLGLSISYGIVQEHGGEIRIQSQLGHGTQISIELPPGYSAPAPEKSRDPRMSVPRRFLVVDDEPEIVRILQRSLSRNGSTVETAASIGEALTLAKATDYDFVITDVKMPGGSGIDLYKQLCGINPSYQSRVVFLTGDTNNPTTVQFLEREGLTYFAKPFDFQGLENFFTKVESPIDND